jgi:phosphatidylinositol glycan class H protein
VLMARTSQHRRSPSTYFPLNAERRQRCTDGCIPSGAMLKIKRPTSTTVLYTVSTRAPTQTLTGHLSNIVFILARIAAGLLVAIILLDEYSSGNSIALEPGSLSQAIDTVLGLPLAQRAVLLASAFPQIWRLILCAATIWLILRKGYTEETLLVIRGLGVQTSTSASSYLWTSGTRFIPTSSIQDIFLHEAFKGFEVRYYLTIVVEGEDEIVVVFPVSGAALLIQVRS